MLSLIPLESSWCRGYGQQHSGSLLINRQHGYHSFGTENPQHCFRYTQQDETGKRSFDIDQRFIFNLHWAPDDFFRAGSSIRARRRNRRTGSVLKVGAGRTAME